MEFQNYIEATGIIPLQIDFSKDSRRTLEEVKQMALERCDRTAEQNEFVDVKCLVVDYKTGNRYMAYSKYMVAKYDVLDYNWILEYDAVVVRQNNELLRSIASYITSYNLPSEPSDTEPYDTKVTYHAQNEHLSQIEKLMKGIK